MDSSERFDFFRYWKTQKGTLTRYWTLYGGFSAFIRSPYLHVAVALTVFSLPFCSQKTCGHDIALSTIPSLLGFTVGALAIVLAFSSAAVFRTLAEDGEPNSFFMKLTTSLIHFIVAQVLAIIIAILAKHTDSKALDITSLFLLYYAILVTLAAGVQLFNTAMIYNANASLSDENDGTK